MIVDTHTGEILDMSSFNLEALRHAPRGPLTKRLGRKYVGHRPRAGYYSDELFKPSMQALAISLGIVVLAAILMSF